MRKLSRALPFCSPGSPAFALTVLGDLHMAPDKQMHLFERAQTQIKDAMAVLVKQNGGSEACHAGIVSLGDLGDYHHGPGSSACFQRSKEWLDRFQLPVGLITGNHDLGESDWTWVCL